MASLTRVSDQNTKMLINYTKSQCLPGVSQPAKGISTIPGRATTSQPYVKTEVDRGMAEESDAVPTILCSLEKVNFLKKCCASPVLRYILHLLADPRQETLCSWHGGPFGVRIWNTRRFTESYNAAMGTKMNFTNISRALQSCELITIAGIRLWKRMKQGEYSFFPGYTEPPVVEQSPSATLYYDCVPNYRLHSPENPCQTAQLPQMFTFDSFPVPLPQFPSPTPSASPLEFTTATSPSYITTPRSCYPVFPHSVLTPPPSDNSSVFSDSFTSSDSSLQRLSPVYDRSSYIPPDQRTKDAVSTSAEMVDQSALDISLVTEFFAPLEAIPSPLPPVEPPSAVVPSSSPISDQYSPFIKDMTHLGEQDIFGNTSSISGEDFSIDETSLLYH
ncbi:unnamed protein product [Nippostrongylus brasiliensis]|uniref:ETS domain-containing protein n=1 Tax=Nippostrongylus brasiliensis TaxID=27835 RepID=A0A0N4YQX1_NIPBR|nr:unnamed protein product [Nippostrongylus brasiliensis]